MNKMDDTRITQSSGNVFADIGLPNPEELQLKARLTHLITEIVENREWTQQQTADTLGIKQPDVSALFRGKRLEHYSVERLMTFLTKLEQKVTITVSSDEIAAQEIVIAGTQLEQVAQGEPQQSF